MKTIFFSLSVFAISSTAISQPWSYNFGTATGNHTTNSIVLSTDAGSYLPATETNGGTARTRIGSAGGSFNIENPGNASLGTNSEIRGVASTSASVNKFSIYDYTASKVFTTKFDVQFGGGTAGTWYFFQGDGANYSDNSAFAGAQVFTGLRFRSKSHV